jgi:hypothetical protein
MVTKKQLLKEGKALRAAASKKTKAKPKKQKSTVDKTPKNVTANIMKVPQRMNSKPRPAKGQVEAICAITDPFCSAAIGARFPDGQTSRTMTSTFRGTFTMTTGATGGVAVAALMAGAPYGYMNVTSATSFPITLPSTFTAWAGSGSGTLFNTYASLYRVVSCGFVLRAIESANNAQGWFTIQQQGNISPSATINGDFLAEINHSVANYPGMQLTYTYAPSNKVVAREFQVLGSNNQSSYQTGFPGAVIYFQGGLASASQNVAMIEYFVNVEWTVNSESSIAPLLPPPPKQNPTAVKAADVSAPKIAGVRTGGTDVVGDAINGIATWALGELASLDWVELGLGAMMLL